ncbi:MAG: DUF1416 domain-containing protein [Actinomycetota bacterium]|nr:DUF1416 domain-containing protein [Actinomycetota bacterium]
MCGATVGGTSLAGVDLSGQAVIQGVVTRDGSPVSGAYVRLLDRGGEFTAEVPTSATGQFRFFAAEGVWTVRALAPRSVPGDRTVHAQVGDIADVTLALEPAAS